MNARAPEVIIVVQCVRTSVNGRLYNRYAVRPKANYKIVERTAHNIVNNDLVKTVNPIATIIALQ